MSNRLKINDLRYGVRFISIFAMFFILYYSILTSKGIYESERVYLTNSIIVFYSLLNIFLDEDKSFSARKFFYLFILLFMGIAPLMQFKQGTQTVGGYDIKESSYYITNILLIIALITFDVSYFISWKRLRINNFSEKYPSKDDITEPLRYKKIILLISIISCLTTLYTYKDNYLLLIFRGINGIETDEFIGAMRYLGPINGGIIRPLTVVCFINYMCMGSDKRYKILLFLLLIISNFPTGLSRLRLAAYYIPCLIVFFPKIKYRNKFILLFLLGFLLVFPFMNNFRTWGEGDFKWLNLNYTIFCDMNYDSYQSFAFVVQNDIIKYGKQLLVVLFFWMPRAIWIDKPYFSGMTVAEENGLWYHQISMNYFGEGYINFGIIGVLIFSVFLGYITAFFDKRFWIYNHGSLHSMYAPFFLFFIGMYFFFMRGDLMYGFEYTACLLLSNYLVYKISYKIINKHS